jgi:hydroxymethylpyrimidine kinase/phosphomethylpyrimidine kinase/thiamine-phosphate diphosphorylase
VSAAQLEAQLQALAVDLPPRAIKTGLLGSVEAIEAVARWVDHLRAQAPEGCSPHEHLALVVDPVLRASAGGASFSHEAIVQAYAEHLLPRATVITPNRAESHALLRHAPSGRPGDEHQHDSDHDHNTSPSPPGLAHSLQALGARSVFITGGDAEPSPHQGVTASHDGQHSIDWLLTPHAQGWLCAPRVATPHHHGTGCTLATAIAAALALGHVEADACVLGKMLTHHALMHSHAAGQGCGPVVARAGFAAGPARGGAPMPTLGLGDALPWAITIGPEALERPDGAAMSRPLFRPFEAPPNGLYGIAADAPQLARAVDAGVHCMQLRHKTPDSPQALDAQVQTSLACSQREGVQVFINDHWQAALDAIERLPMHGRVGLHLGQEDLLALSPTDQQRLLGARSRVMLGLSSHSLWELARAVGCGASYIACGPVQATITKDMPWRPQGVHNLSWWVANSPSPVVGIGGLLTPQDLQRHAQCQPAALCVVRALSDGCGPLVDTVEALSQAIQEGLAFGQDPGSGSGLSRARALGVLAKPVLSRQG